MLRHIQNMSGKVKYKRYNILRKVTLNTVVGIRKIHLIIYNNNHNKILFPIRKRIGRDF